MNTTNILKTGAVAVAMAMLLGTAGAFAQGMGPGGGKGDCPNKKDGRGYGPGHKGMHGQYMRPGGRPGHCMFFGDVQRLKEKLALSDDQVNQIEKINLKFKKTHLSLREKMAPQKIRLRRLLLEDKVDLKSVKALLKEIAALEVDARYARIKHRLDIEQVLTQDQKRKLRSERKMQRHRRYDR